MTATIDGFRLEGVSATTLWTLHDPAAARFPGGALMFDSIPRWFGERTRDVALPRGRGAWRLGSAAVNHFGPLRRNRPSIALLEFG